jgi:hypothetical protein
MSRNALGRALCGIFKESDINNIVLRFILLAGLLSWAKPDSFK